MKKTFVLLFLGLALCLGFNSGAQAAPALIKTLNCSGRDVSHGTTRVALGGTYFGKTYLLISNVSPVGIPFSQQAEVTGVTLIGDILVFELHTVLSNGDLRLSLEKDTNQGRLSAAAGGAGIEMTCSADVQSLE